MAVNSAKSLFTYISLCIVIITIKSASCNRPTYMEERSSASFYEGCGSTKLCFGDPSPCFKHKNCTTAVSVNVNNFKYTFELIGRNNPAYVAVGLSADKNMGSDSVMECQQRSGAVDLFGSWTFPQRDPYVSRQNVSTNITQVLEKSITNGVIYCRFTRDIRSNINKVQFDLSKDKYYLLLVAGSEIYPNSVGYHDRLFIATGSKVSLSEKKILYEDSKAIYKLHGTFMLIAWILLSNCGIMIARYYKKNWIDQQLCGSDMWFSLHRICMVSTWVLTMAAFIMIFVEVGGWVSPTSKTHAILGIITIVLCFFQPIGAFFRPHPDEPNRIVFNVIHKSCGTIANLLAKITLFFSVSLTRVALPTWMTYVLAAFVVFHLIIHLTLFIMDNYRDGRFDYGNVFHMYNANDDNDVNTRMPPVTAEEFINKSVIREILLGVYISINVAFLIALICILWLAPFNKK